MKRRVFYSFHYQNDYWRTQQIRNIGSIEGNSIATSNQWETIKHQGEQAIKNWIDRNLFGKSCLIVLVGSQTANRKWINYEICQAWNKGIAVFGIRINFLKDRFSQQSNIGDNPFHYIEISNELSKIKLSQVVTLHEPYDTNSKNNYMYISANIENWIESAINDRQKLNY